MRENERNRDLKKLFRFVTLSLSLTIIFIHIPRIFSFREERERELRITDEITKLLAFVHTRGS